MSGKIEMASYTAKSIRMILSSSPLISKIVCKTVVKRTHGKKNISKGTETMLTSSFHTNKTLKAHALTERRKS